jgi:hypothetical protein
MTNDEFLSLCKGDLVCLPGSTISSCPGSFDWYGIVIKEAEFAKTNASQEDYYSVCFFWMHEEKRGWLTNNETDKMLVEKITIEARADGSKV